MASKLNFRARTLDSSKPMSIYYAEDLPELADINAINRSVPAMPSGMEKEEEAEKHLQDILESQAMGHETKEELVIPTPEVFETNVDVVCKSLYKDGYKLPRQYIHVQPFSVDQDLPDYDLDEEDEEFLTNILREQKKFEVYELTLEDMLDRLERNSGHSVVSAKEAKQLLKEDDDLILAVYDYWVDKRLRLKNQLTPQVKSEKRDGSAGSSNPYIAFRRRTEKMQTRKNRKNDEASYEKMLKLRRDLSRAVTLLEMVKRREKTKKEHLNLTADVFERRYHSDDFDGKILAELTAQLRQRVLQPVSISLKYGQENWLNQGQHQYGSASHKRSHNKKKRHKSSSSQHRIYHLGRDLSSSEDESGTGMDDGGDAVANEEAEAPFAFRRKRHCQYLAPLLDDDGMEQAHGWAWEAPEVGGGAEARFRYSLASLSTPKPRCIGMVRRRVGRGGRVILDRAYANYDSLWRSLDFSVLNGCGGGAGSDVDLDGDSFEDWPHYRPEDGIRNSRDNVNYLITLKLTEDGFGNLFSTSLALPV